MTFINKYPHGLNDKLWCMKGLSMNKILDWEFVHAHPEGLNGQSWDIFGLS